MGDVIRLSPSTHQRHRVEQSYEFAPALDEALGSIAKTLRCFEAEGGSGSSLCVLNTPLLDLLTTVDGDPQVEVAVDHLYEAARRLTLERQREVAPEHQRYADLAAAYLRLRQQVAAARPRAEQSYDI